MTAAILLKRTENVRVRNMNGKKVAILPLKAWEDIEDYFEELAWSQSPRFIAKIKQAREDIKKGRYFTLEEVKKRLLKK